MKLSSGALAVRLGALLAYSALALSFSFYWTGAGWPEPYAPPAVYVSIIVKACPRDPKSMEPCAPAATGAQGLPPGMCPRAEDWGGEGEYESARQHSRNKAERHEYFRSIGCIDVPIPPEIIHADMTMARCAGKGGYFVAMQYLEQNPTIAQKSVGEWVCIPHLTQPEGVANM